jgi:hypothetical protein
LISINASLYDSYAITITGGPVTIQINNAVNYTPFDGQKLILRIYSNSSYALNWTFTNNNFRVVGIAPPQITLVNSTMYIGIMYNQSVTQWDILSAVIQ